MIRTYIIYRDNVTDTVNWLKANLSDEGVRWWWSPVVADWAGADYREELQIFIDVAEDEESMLTAFVLKYG